MINPSMPAATQPPDLQTKLGYGVGEMSSEIPGSILVFFLLFFLTNVAGLNPALAGSVLLVGKVWDAINDPLVGWLSDRTRSPWGRRYPWMVWGAVPLGLCFVLQWWVPPLSNQIGLFGYYSAIAFLFYAASTAVIVPYSTLAAELTRHYDERTSLVSYKAAFSIGSSIVGLILAQLIFTVIADPRNKYLVMGGICGGLATLAVFLCIWGTYRRFREIESERALVERPTAPPFWWQMRVALRNRPFLYVVGIYLCSWLGLQVTAAMLPYFVVNWMGLPEHHFTQMALVVQGTALLTMLVWGWLGQKFGKRAIYCMGIPLTLIAQAGLFFLQPGQIGWMYGLGALAGAGLATAYLVPWSMLPDVVDLDELNTGQRREGIFYGFVVQLKKIGVAIALFVVSAVLEWAGLVSGGADQVTLTQPDSALQAIRWLVAPVPSIVLIGGLVLAYFYPITRERHQQIVMQLGKSSDRFKKRSPSPLRLMGEAESRE
ncbi:MFS transporter [Egbenema bharatensis]|uniref:MFS transporter n=1 Tax=Egbenema bharatensis TaxID=3463334 RepID=UPI003A83E968